MQFIVHRSLSSKLLIPLLLTALVVVASVLAVVSYTRSRAVEEAGVATGRAMTSQVVTLRNFYTAEIAARAKKAGMALGIDFRDKNNTLPLPATLVKALGESITQEFPGTHLRLLSRYPFPHRAADNKLDVFQAQALAALEGDSKTPVHSVEPVDGRLSVRYAVADVMKEGCVACHNSHPQSPKRDWKVGDVRGIIEVVVPVDQVDRSIAQSAMAIGTLVVVGFCLLGLVLYVVTQRIVSRPLREAAGVMERVADGDLAAPTGVAGPDEVGRLFGALQAMTAKLRHTLGQVQHSAESIQVASSEVAAGNADMSTRTEQTASRLQQAAGSMEQLAGTVRQSAEAAAQADNLASSAWTVAQRGGQVVTQVVTTMDDINASARKIADIISVIDGIAFQTNILALNAAVEAARAGEQGRGFAVVAAEVRSLAQRSAGAAKEIKALIGTSVDKVEIGAKLVQEAGTTMNEIVTSVKHVSDIIGEITAAAGEQNSGIDRINKAVTQLDQMTLQNAALVEQSAAAAESLKEQAHKLHGALSAFRFGPGRA